MDSIKTDYNKALANLTYAECKNIYINHALGKRIAEALPNFALSKARVVRFGSLPQSFITRFIDTCNRLQIDELVRRTSIYARVFGMSAIYVAHPTADSTQPLTLENLEESNPTFNALDTLNISGSRMDQNPLSASYQQITHIQVAGKYVSAKRICCVFNANPVYQTFMPSTFNFGSPSCYQNLHGLLQAWDVAQNALERLTTKAAAIIYKSRDDSVINSILYNATKRSNEMIAQLKNGGVASIPKDAELELFNLSGIGEIDILVERINKSILLALGDTPEALLLDKEFASGFNNGSLDAAKLMVAVDLFRNNIIKPLYLFIDSYIMHIAFNKVWRKQALVEYKDDLEALEITDEMTLLDYLFEHYELTLPPLIEESEEIKANTIKTRLEAAKLTQELGTQVNIKNLVDKELPTIEKVAEKPKLVKFTDIKKV